MLIRSLLVLVALLPSLRSQADPLARAAASPSFAISDSCNLQPDADAEALRGTGAHYSATFTAAGVRFEPALGRGVEQTQHLTLGAPTVQCGGREVTLQPSPMDPRLAALTANYAHGSGITEHWLVRPKGVEVSWRFERPLATSGDLLVRYAVTTSLPAAATTADGGVAFVLPGVGGVSIGGVTGIDALGRKVAGGVHCADGVLTLSLPAAFLAEAEYPVVLDPTVGPVFNVGPWQNSGEPDTAYDTITDTYLVVWEETFAANDVRIHGQRVLGSGSLAGGLIVFGSSGIATRPRVADQRMRSRYAVVWNQLSGTTSTVRLQTVAAGTGAITHTLNVATSTTSTVTDVDVAGEGSPTPGAQHDLSIVYHDHGLSAIRLRRVYFDAADVIHGLTPVSLWSDFPSALSYYSQPAISRAAGTNGFLLVVARRAAGIAAVPSIESCVVAIDGSGLGPFATVVPGATGVNLLDPDVDGFENQWVLTYRGATAFNGYYSIPVNYSAATTTLSAGLPILISTGSRAPSVGFSPARSWIGYRTSSPNSDQLLELACVNSADGQYCDTLIATTVMASWVANTTSWRIVAATGTSGGSPTSETGLMVWSEPVAGGAFGLQVGYQVRAQRLRSYGTGGTITNRGGGCGTAGTQTFSHNPAIGSNDFECSINSLPAGALLTIFNFSAIVPKLVCGPCQWVPFAVTVTPPIVANSASVSFPIPCLPSLVGALFETQWTTLDFAQAPCGLLPGFAVSDRSAIMIGQ